MVRHSVTMLWYNPSDIMAGPSGSSGSMVGTSVIMSGPFETIESIQYYSTLCEHGRTSTL